MLVIMSRDATEEQIRSVVETIHTMGFAAHSVRGAVRTAIGITGNTTPIDRSVLESLPGVIESVRVTKSYKLVSREIKPEDTQIHVRDVTIGGKDVVVISGPCSVESRDLIIQTAQLVKEAGAHMLRGGAFKPRTSPYSYQGMGEEAYKLLAEAREVTGLPIVSEVIDAETVDMAKNYVDVLQIGARNMQNFALLKHAARSGKAILLKRNPAATLEELMNAAEYILVEGNSKVILCERGVKGFSDFSRNTLDLSIIPAIKEVSHLPVIVDPSHATGKRNMISPLARAAIATGADGVMIEVHPDPEKALSDGFQALYPQQLSALMTDLAQLAAVVGRNLKLPR
jgi:3-deoxy-7-phosphoheptulonate synthase